MVESLASGIRPICVYCGRLLYLCLRFHSHKMEMVIWVSCPFFTSRFKQNHFVERSVGHLCKNCQMSGLNQIYGCQQEQFCCWKEPHMQGYGQRWGRGGVWTTGRWPVCCTRHSWTDQRVTQWLQRSQRKTYAWKTSSVIWWVCYSANWSFSELNCDEFVYFQSQYLHNEVVRRI